MTILPSPDEADGAGAAQPLLPHDLSRELDALRGVQYRMPPDLEGFYDLYARAHLRYAHTLLGDEDAARTVVRRVYVHLALNWVMVLKEESPAAYAFSYLKQCVETHLRLTGSVSQNLRTEGLRQAARATLEAMRRQLRVMDSSLGLFTAIASLPPRQYDVIVLRYVLGYPCSHIAYVMGIKADTVRTHRRLAKERIATKLGLSTPPAADEQELEEE
ncbi:MULTISPECIES: RNA polymerase sigma factor [Streptomyces]|uniref:RNA polymerase sigma factor n=1 Tax=Streptomyces TaxID=1883 RepID=UPI00163BE64D|nr:MULTISPECIES: sigma-70 family RNA polymerase sigma factor [Streptomyces]MBC2876372.1 sigma-70 family RNA polymerase sigma factor [Streptomyces sp. TYQ1024]UBI35411.1 sigma-70 family RNA polymerase sigma factor [Streptomyces mobaraensis]UKW28003.1 sigma-70 family RNA polymerase sigma factor [Streptomyces sp. TYQ1024]